MDDKLFNGINKIHNDVREAIKLFPKPAKRDNVEVQAYLVLDAIDSLLVALCDSDFGIIQIPTDETLDEHLQPK